MPRVEKECPRCKGERGFWSMPKNKGTWSPCIMCRTQGVIKVASMSEYRRIKHQVENPQKVQTKQREKEKPNA
jgi:hypothetical protein